MGRIWRVRGLELGEEEALDVHLLHRGERGVDQPVERAPRREVQREPPDQEGEQLHDRLGRPVPLRLLRLLALVSVAIGGEGGRG